MNPPNRLNWPALLTLVVGALAVVALVAWQCLIDPAIPFLSARSPADWIVHPTPWILEARQVKERRVRFRTTFDLDAPPQAGRVRLRAFRGYVLWVNGSRIAGEADLAAAWKREQQHDVTGALRAGGNDLEVEVVHVTGPPALWLVLRADRTTVKTDGTWQSQTADGPWQPVRLADEPMQHPVVRTSPTVAEGWRRSWRFVLACSAAAALAVGIGGWVSRRGRAASASSGRLTEGSLLGLVVVLWVALSVNNLLRLPPVVGFDASAHFEYLRFLEIHHRLPLASDGWEMYQPPLYYVATALLVSAGRSAGWTDAPAAIPKMLSMIGGLAQIVLVWCVLGLLFPESRRTRLAGLILAAAMPMNLYMSQYPSNEMVSVALVTAGLVLALRILRHDATTWRACAALGVVLGLGMLAKHTAFLAVVVVVAVLAGRIILGGVRRWRLWLTRVGVTAAAVLLVAGWYSLRNVIHFGNPLVGNWDPASGNVWWQDPGVGTSANYTRFGRCLTEPFYSSLYSYADGVFSTVWGDGMCAGIPDVAFRAPWHYDLMAAGYTLAWLPTVLIAIGLIAAVVGWVRRPTASWALVAGHGLLVGFAVFYMTLKLPYHAQAKGFYGLTAMACLCALGAWGFDLTGRAMGRLRFLLWIPLLIWAINAYASYVVLPLTARDHDHMGQVFGYQGNPDRGIEHFCAAVRKGPGLIDAYVRLGGLLHNQQRYAEAKRAWQDGLARDPNHLEMLHSLAWLLATCPDATVRDGPAARDLAERACRLTERKTAIHLDALAAALAETGRFDEAIKTLERAIELARSNSRRDVIPAMRSRLADYHAGRPYRLPGR